jgi:hypothetical protein
MKRLFLILSVIFFASSTAFSTEQYPDRLIIGKDTIYLKSFPLENMILRLKKSPFDYGKYGFPSTGCYRGYVATWQIIDETLTLNEVKKIDSARTKLDIIEYFKNNGYNPKTINGYIVADWYSDTLKLYNFFRYNFALESDEFYISKDYLREKDKKIELVFENGKLVRNNIIPIEDYKLGDTLSLVVYYYQNWLTGYKNVTVQGVIRENNGKKVRLEILSFGTKNKGIIRRVQKEIMGNLGNSENDLSDPLYDSKREGIKKIYYFWINPRYCKRIE